MKNKAMPLTMVAVLGASFLLAGCPYYHRPHAPHPHRPHVPHPRLPLDSMLQLEGQNSVAMLSIPAADNLRHPE